MGLIEIIVGVLLLVWIGGFLLDIGGSLIHALLVIAIVLFALRFFRRAV